MDSVQMRLSVFNAEKMRHVVGVGNSSAYRIRVSKGNALGSLGVVEIPVQCSVANSGDFLSSERTGLLGRFRSIINS